MTRSPLLTAVVAAFQALPYLLFGLPAGALADRFDRKRVMVAADLANAAVLASIPVASSLGNLTVTHLLFAAFLVPAFFVFFDAADFGAVPLLAGRERIAAANSAIWSTSTIVETVVPLVAGALLAFVDAAILLGVDAISYVASALLIRGILRPLSDPFRRASEPLSLGAVAADVRQGLHFVWGHRTVRSMTAVGTTQSIAGGAFIGQMVVWADVELRVRAGDPRLGAVISAALCVATALARTWTLGTFALMAWGAAYMLVVINSITYRQQVTPEALMSRVNTTGRMLSFGLGWPTGSLLGGVVAESAGPQVGMLTGGLVLAAGAALAWLSPLRREGRTPAVVAP